MIRSATLQDEQANRRHLTLSNGTGYWRSDLLLSPEGTVPAPQAFLIQQDPGTLIRSHFHATDQFQVVAEGGGTLGRHALEPISVHYASKHTGYGPITSGERGLSYFTFRAITTPYAHFLPESRELMEDLPRRNLIGHAVAVADASANVTVDTSIERQADGVGAWLLRLPPAAVHREASEGADRFYLVARGTLLACREALPRFATAFVSAEEPTFEMTAGGEGADVLVLQFAKRLP